MFKSFDCCVVTLLVVCVNLFAGEVVFNNGDRLTGVIVKLTDGKLVIDSEIAGSITVDVEKVKTFQTDEPVEIVLSDNQTVTRTIQADKSEAGMVTAGKESLSIVDIAAINPERIKYPVWSGEITASYTSKEGNTRSTDITADMKLKRHTSIHDLFITGEHDFSQKINNDNNNKVTTEDSWLLKAKDQFQLRERTYGYIEASFERNRIANLDRRVMEGVGIGEKWIDNDKTHFQTDIGVANIDERYTDLTSNNSVAGQMGYSFDHKINGSVSFLHDLMLYPSIEERSDYYLYSHAELRFDVTKRLFTNFKIVYDYDNMPAKNSKKRDVKYLFGIGYKF